MKGVIISNTLFSGVYSYTVDCSMGVLTKNQ